MSLQRLAQLRQYLLAQDRHACVAREVIRAAWYIKVVVRWVGWGLVQQLGVVYACVTLVCCTVALEQWQLHVL